MDVIVNNFTFTIIIIPVFFYLRTQQHLTVATFDRLVIPETKPYNIAHIIRH